jgi:hypothetical protein
VLRGLTSLSPREPAGKGMVRVSLLPLDPTRPLCVLLKDRFHYFLKVVRS